MIRLKSALTVSFFLISASAYSHFSELRGDPESLWVAVKTKDKYERSKLANLDMSIESVIDDTSYGFIPKSSLAKLQANGLEVSAQMGADKFRMQDFPTEDSNFHNYAEQKAELDQIAALNPKIAKVFSLGKSLEGREIWAIHINTDLQNEGPGIFSAKPGIVYMGGHHAREHLSVEMPLMYARYLVESFSQDQAMAKMISSRDIYFIPSVNPDGSEFDIASGSYQMWRKNRSINSGSNCRGVDLNRNYGFKWGTGGSSTNPCSDVFMGPKPFSEPETQAIKKFVEDRPNLKVLLSFHTFSELVLYPWGHKYDPVEKPDELATYKKMAESMASWNQYTPEQSSDLYIASGDTTDWSYGQLGIFSFTFELSPRDMWGGGGFYPGQGVIPQVFQANLKPVLYLLDLADNPKRAITAPETTLFYRTM